MQGVLFVMEIDETLPPTGASNVLTPAAIKRALKSLDRFSKGYNDLVTRSEAAIITEHVKNLTKVMES